MGIHRLSACPPPSPAPPSRLSGLRLLVLSLSTPLAGPVSSRLTLSVSCSCGSVLSRAALPQPSARLTWRTAPGGQARYLNMGTWAAALGGEASFTLRPLLILSPPVSLRSQDTTPQAPLPLWAVVGQPEDGNLGELGRWQPRYKVWMEMHSAVTAGSRPQSGPASTLVSLSAFSAPASTGHSLRPQAEALLPTAVWPLLCTLPWLFLTSFFSVTSLHVCCTKCTWELGVDRLGGLLDELIVLIRRSLGYGC